MEINRKLLARILHRYKLPRPTQRENTVAKASYNTRLYISSYFRFLHLIFYPFVKHLDIVVV